MADHVVKFPSPIIFDEPKAGFARLILTVKGLDVTKPLFGKARPSNADINASFDNGVIQVIAKITTKDGQQVSYKYMKNLPYDVVDKDCKYEVADQQIVVTLVKKVKTESWGSQGIYFMQPPTAVDS